MFVFLNIFWRLHHAMYDIVCNDIQPELFLYLPTKISFFDKLLMHF